MSTLLECKDLTKCYGKKTAIDHINLAIESGHIIGLLGPNGSGKTTLIKMINGLLAPTSGSIFMQQNPIGTESKKHISYLPDHTYLNMNERVRDIIRIFLISMKILTKSVPTTCWESFRLTPRIV